MLTDRQTRFMFYKYRLCSTFGSENSLGSFQFLLLPDKSFQMKAKDGISFFMVLS